MALKATIYKGQLDLADMDRHVYTEHNLTLARHPSETDERMLICLLAFALNAPSDNDRGALELAKDMWEPDEPGLWQKDHTGLLVHWIEVGQPDEKRILRVCARSERVSVYSFSSSTPVWWAGIAGKLARLENLTLGGVPSDESQQLAALAQRTMNVQVTVQDGAIYVSEGQRSVAINLARLHPRC
jgi:uncharacterized protein YaeQ